MPRFVLFRILPLVSLLWPAVVAAEPSPDVAVWEQVSLYLSREADQAVRKLPEASDAQERRERDFCAAVVYLDQQPLSESRLDEADRRLQQLVAAEGNDAIARASRYLLGRIAQIYRAEPAVELAAKHFRGLVDEPGPGEWEELARVKLALLTLYVLPAKNPAERINQVETFVPEARDPLAVRDLHRLIARATLFYNLDPKQALAHLLKADEIGGLAGALGADQLVQIGELAWDAGEEELAAKYYVRLREEYPRDPRIFVMNERLAGHPYPHRGEEINGR